LHQLINNILDLSKIEANQLSIEIIPIALCDLMMEIETFMTEQAHTKGLKFVFDCQFPIPKIIQSDPTRLKQILINLCGNAIKFTAEGTVTLRVNYDKLQHKMVFSVEDSGIGMTPEQSDQLFKPFKQADNSTTRKFGGSGLGLFISKQLVECLGGHLTLKSQIGIGSQFIVTLNLDENSKGEISNIEWINSAKEAQQQSQYQQLIHDIPKLKGKVLLAEDNLDNQILISLYLKKAGINVTTVENGLQAVDTAITGRFNLILMDMQMPVMGGIEATRRLRQHQCITPIAMLTANALKENIQQSLDAGANEFLTKPIDRRLFYDVLEKYLEPGLSVNENSVNNTSSDPLDDIRDLVDAYVNKLPDTCERINQHVANTAWKSVADEIHQLKGTGSAFGLPEITKLCTDIEISLAKKQTNSVHQLINQLNDICESITENHIPLV